ncbi:MAG: hypothetical protein JSV86_06750 [Gemmatimonadota bacterium]|nr:MAG: hypothetical protein JSV86_06750 [Gemmatimonadota bacterium]
MNRNEILFVAGSWGSLVGFVSLWSPWAAAGALTVSATLAAVGWWFDRNT